MTAESTPQPRNRPLRWAVGCLVLFAAAAILQYTLFDKVRYIAGLFIEDPLAVAQGYADAGHLRQAADYIDFYQSLPLVTEADARRLDPLKDEIAKERSTLTYRTSEVARGFFLGRGEEEYGIAAGLVSELTSVADIRDLAREGAAWANDEEVDVFTTTLAGAGLALTIASVGPQAALAAPAKSGLALVKIARRTGKLSRPMQESIVRSVKALVRETDAAGKPTAAAARRADAIVKPLAELASYGKKEGVANALEVLARSDDLAEIPRTIRAAQSFGPAAGRVLRFAGPDVVRATERAGAQGVLEAAKFGPRAVSRLQKTPARRLMDDIARWAKAAAMPALQALDLILSLVQALLGMLGSIFAYFALKACKSLRRFF